MKRRIFLACLFYCFFRLSIYESIAAIFLQSASYVFFCFNPIVCQADQRLRFAHYVFFYFAWVYEGGDVYPVVISLRGGS